MNRISRLARALVGALRMTLRGEVAPAPHSIDALAAKMPQTAAWLRETAALLDGLDETAAKAITVRVEKREMTAATILGAVRYHAAEEYPHLLLSGGQYARMAVQASNLNDQFLVAQLAAAPHLPDALRQTADKLAAHLGTFPSE